MVQPCADPSHSCDSCYAFPYGWTIADIKSQKDYVRVTFAEGVTAYLHETRGYTNYHFREDGGPGMPEAATPVRRAHEFIARHPGGRLLPDANGRTIVQVRTPEVPASSRAGMAPRRSS
jgi:hypothetical protein